ncbi:MAG: restriction endonuclease subunit S [Nitrospira sp.]|nr:MAG: restriction endonuclease subunit S [Nitrospira sp.]
MEVKAGYKPTEVGVIPVDWKITKLGTHATFKTGPFGSALHQSDYVDDGVPVINPMQIIDGKIQPTPSMAITEAAARTLSEFRLSEGNVVIGRRGEMGRCAFVRAEEHGWLCGTGSMIIRTGPSLDARFIQRVLSSPPIIAEIENASVGSTMINLNQGTLGNLLVPLPPTKAEQEAIAEALSDADALIESLEQLLAKKRQLKQGAMQELLTGKKRLPGFSGKWEVKRIGEFTDCTAGGTPSTLIPAYWNGSIRWMSSGELNLKFANEVEGRITEDGLRNSSAQLVPVKSVLIGLAGQGKTRGTVAMNLVELCTNQSVAAIFPNSSFVSEYLYYNLDARYEELRGLSSGGAGRGGLNLTLIKSISVPFPCFDEQAAIAAILSDMDAEIAALEAKLAKACQLKQGMMQELLTGRIRLV